MFLAEAVLFDVDGVVIDTRQSVVDFWQTLAEEHSVTLTNDDFDRHVHGVPAGAIGVFLVPCSTRLRASMEKTESPARTASFHFGQT